MVLDKFPTSSTTNLIQHHFLMVALRLAHAKIQLRFGKSKFSFTFFARRGTYSEHLSISFILKMNECGYTEPLVHTSTPQKRVTCSFFFKSHSLILASLKFMRRCKSKTFASTRNRYQNPWSVCHTSPAFPSKNPRRNMYR